MGKDSFLKVHSQFLNPFLFFLSSQKRREWAEIRVKWCLGGRFAKNVNMVGDQWDCLGIPAVVTQIWFGDTGTDARLARGVGGGPRGACAGKRFAPPVYLRKARRGGWERIVPFPPTGSIS